MKIKIKEFIFHALICIGLLCAMWGAYYVAKHIIRDRMLVIENRDFSWVYQVDSAEMRGDSFYLNGFAFELDVDSEEKAYTIVLQDIDSGKNYFPKMEYLKRKDVNDYFKCEYDYTDSGFQAVINANKITGKNYEVLLKVEEKRTAYRTGTYLSDGRLMYVNPYEYQPLEVQGTDLEELVAGGVLRVYRPDCGMYVYQYNNELYWIAEPDYGFVDGDAAIQYLLDTTQIERLPKISLGTGWPCDDIGVVFSKCEMLESDTGKYRVARKELPKEYSVRRIVTGNYYIDGWIWKEDFFPFYQFQ